MSLFELHIFLPVSMLYLVLLLLGYHVDVVCVGADVYVFSWCVEMIPLNFWYCWYLSQPVFGRSTLCIYIFVTIEHHLSEMSKIVQCEHNLMHTVTSESVSTDWTHLFPALSIIFYIILLFNLFCCSQSPFTLLFTFR